MSEFVTAAASADKVARLWGNRFVGEFAGVPRRVRDEMPHLAAVLDGITAPGGPRRVAGVWGDLDAGDDRVAWLFTAWPSLTDALDEILMATLFDSGGF